jgi:hypothetical protein
VRLHDVDFVLVCYEKLKYDAAMKIRKEMGVFFDDKFLSPKLKEKVKLLAEQASAGNLSVFIGAGYALHSPSFAHSLDVRFLPVYRLGTTY